MNKSNRRFFQKKKFEQKPRSQPQPPGHPHPRPDRQASQQPAVFVEGVLDHKGKVGFVLSEVPGQTDVLVQAPSLKLAMGGDRVRVRLTSPAQLKPGERRTGEIVEVLVRSKQGVVGTFQRRGNLPVVVPEGEGPEIHLTDLGSLVPHVGDIVVARVQTWPTAQKAGTAALLQVLGPRDAPGVDLQTLIHKHELPDAFPPEVTAQSDAYGEEVPESAWKDRETFFDRRVFTIDGADAKDFDDAVHLEKLPNGEWRLGVHIADVAQYVTENSALDKEAYRRGTSVYLSGTVIPMLPFPLSDNLCSLRPDRVRLTLSCVMDINARGEVAQARVLESAIRSARRFTYEEVEAILKDGEMPPNVTPEVAADVREMGELAQLLRKKRFSRGSLDFDFPEPEVILDIKGRPNDIRKRQRLESHRLIEDFMLLANEAVARHMKDHPFIYRVHETPDPAKLEKLEKSLQLMGLQLPRHLDPTHPAALQHVIKESEGTPLQAVVHLMVLRSLKQAVYSPVNKGHFGIASACYTHFTSPIRRYPDLIVHRIVKERLHNSFKEAWWKKELPVIAGHTSKRERTAVEAEREYMDIQRVRLMETHVGETFSGVIASVTNFGLFIQLDQYFVEGLVHITTLGNDYYIFDEARMTLRGRRTGQTFSMGQKVEVQLAKADVVKHQLDFQLVSSGRPAASRPPASGHPQKHHPRDSQGKHRRHRRR